MGDFKYFINCGNVNDNNLIFLVKTKVDFVMEIGAEKKASSTEVINMLNPLNFHDSIGFDYVS